MNSSKFLLVLMTSALFSCSNENDVIYSCDESTDLWVKKHIEEIHSMTRADWLNVDDKVKIASFRAFTNEQKRTFWEDKISETLKLDWNNMEREHIMKLSEFIETHSDFFEVSRLTEEQDDELEIFFYKWLRYSLDVLHWDKQVVYAITCTGYSLKNTIGELNILTSSINNVEKLTNSSENQTQPDCNCKLDHLFSCFAGNDECKDIDCDEGLGCGWLLLQTCTGKCGF